MIRLYRKEDSEMANRIQESLKDIVIAHDVVIVHSKNELPNYLQQNDLPVLIDDKDVVSGEQALLNRIKILQKLMKDWDRFKSDACYVDDDINIC